MPKNNYLLTGNVGEWSEIYVFLRLLSTGRMDVADETLTALPNVFYKIVAILRREADTENEYLRADDAIKILVKNNSGEVHEFAMSVERFATNADALLEKLKLQVGRSTASYPDIQDFLRELKIYSIKDVGHHKHTITISLVDFRNGMFNKLGFSIKSFLNASSILFNAGPGTNFIYKVTFPEGVSVDCDQFNRETIDGSPGKIACRLARILELGGTISFHEIQSACLSQNLRTIDTGLHQIMAQCLLIRYLYNVADWHGIVEKLNEINPLQLYISRECSVYEYKIKRFLQDAAMGMTPESHWCGNFDADGGQIVVKKDGEIVCYHIYELRRYLQYLFNETRLEQPSTCEDEANPGHPRIDPATGKPKKPFLFGWLYQENGEYFIKINLQVRFKGLAKTGAKRR